MTGNSKKRRQQRQFRWLWKSELGNNYEKDYIEDQQDNIKEQLRKLCRLPENRVCADCETQHNSASWASVNLGVFLCIRCASHHRVLSISKPKECTMDLWGPDELSNLKRLGNENHRDTMPDICPPPLEAPDEVWRIFLIDKYGQTQKEARGRPPVSIELIDFNKHIDNEITRQPILRRGFHERESPIDAYDSSWLPSQWGAEDIEKDFSNLVGLVCEHFGSGDHAASPLVTARGVTTKSNESCLEEHQESVELPSYQEEYVIR